MKKLNIGAGKTYIPGYVNIDIDEKAEVTLNLSEDPLPFEDNSVDLIFSYHTLEHVPNYIFALTEIYRVLKPGGILLLGVPYVTLTKYNLVNPYHLHHFNEYSFDLFDTDKVKGSAVEDNTVNFKKVYHKCYYMGIFNLMPYPFNKWCRDHLFNVVRKIDYGIYAVKGDMKGVRIPTKSELKAAMKEAKQARIPYVKQPKKKSNRYIRRIKAWWNGH